MKITLHEKYKVCGVEESVSESLNHCNVKLLQQSEIAWDRVGRSRASENQIFAGEHFLPFLLPHHPSNSLIVVRDFFFLFLISACIFTCNYLLKRCHQQLHYFSPLSTVEEHRKKVFWYILTINDLCQVWKPRSENGCHLYPQHIAFPSENVVYECMIAFDCWL